MEKRLILASSSPRRQDLLKQAHIPFVIQQSNIDESQIVTTDPVEKVQQLARLKNESLSIYKDDVILSADTVVAYQQHIFEKPKNKEEAFRMMSVLSGNTHDVYTGVMIRSLQETVLFVEQTQVEFWPLSNEEIVPYIHTKDPYDKAGGYGIQSIGAQFVRQINGDYYNVVGLPLSRVVRELAKFDIYPKFYR